MLVSVAFSVLGENKNSINNAFLYMMFYKWMNEWH